MKATVTMNDADISEALREWGTRRGVNILSHRLNVDLGDTSDPRGGGRRTESIVLEVEFAPPTVSTGVPVV